MNSFHRHCQRLIVILALSVLVLVGWTGNQGAIAATRSSTAQATLRDPAGQSKLSGQVAFTETKKGLLIQATVQNAPPGEHGFHIHEKASCGDKGNAAGGHFNPDRVKHGRLLSDGFANAHAGDLGNLLIKSDGTGSLKQTIPGLSLQAGKYAIAHHAVILHALKDDFGQPTGNAGGRIGCGTIALAQP